MKKHISQHFRKMAHKNEDCTILSRTQQAKRTNMAHLNHTALTAIPREIYRLSRLARLDLGHNHIEFISKEIGHLSCLQQLWVNDNPLRELPKELALCAKLTVIDARNTLLCNLPRELSRLHQLQDLELAGCPLKPSLLRLAQGTGGVADVMAHLKRKDERSTLRDALVRRLQATKYIDEPTAVVTDVSTRVFRALKDLPLTHMSKLIHEAERIFPHRPLAVHTDDIRRQLHVIVKEAEVRHAKAQIQLHLRTVFLDPSLDDIVSLARDIYNELPDPADHMILFKRPKTFFTSAFGQTCGASLKSSLGELRLNRSLKREKAQELDPNPSIS
eukprot:GILJ01003659.1.p1 GENE.GILJ01003659.1~~GILJ01003659.1.p1  ORF type:complete len:331 (+),score=34.06 GILJ01003659.1:80-1072(+)